MALADVTNKVFRVNMARGYVVREVQLKRRRLSADSKDDLMAIAMPDDNTVHTFWVEGGKMILTTIREGERDRIRRFSRIEYRVVVKSGSVELPVVVESSSVELPTHPAELAA